MSTLSVPETITNGSSLDATEVQSNFDAIESFINSDVVTVDGGKSFTGAVTLPNASPSNDNHAARKKYVDDTIAAHTVSTAQIEDAAVTAAKLATDAVETAKIKDANVTNAKMANATYSNIKGIAASEYCGRMKMSGAQSIPHNTETIVYFDGTDDFDYSGMHDPVTNNERVTAAVGMVLHVDYCIPWSANTAGGRLAVVNRYNSSGVLQQSFAHAAAPASSVSFGTYLNGSGQCLMAAGDFIQVRVTQTSGGALDVVDSTGITAFVSWHCVRLT